MSRFQRFRAWASEHENELLIGIGALVGAAAAGAFVGAQHKRERHEVRDQFFKLGQVHGAEIAELHDLVDRLIEKK